MQHQKWHDDAKRLGGEELIPVITQMQENHFELADKFKKSFPAGDHEGHCRYHELIIERTAEIKKLRLAVQEKTISGLIWAAIVSIGIAVFHEAQRIFTK